MTDYERGFAAGVEAAAKMVEDATGSEFLGCRIVDSKTLAASIRALLQKESP